MQDPIADLLSCLRNAQTAGLKTVSVPASQMKINILQVLCQEGYIANFIVESLPRNKKSVTVTLKYYQNRPVIEKIQRVSRPSKRVYRSCTKLPRVRGGLGVAVISTSRGLMSDNAARLARVGGEIVCIVE
jgi:small subunit ribosomal protein S8